LGLRLSRCFLFNRRFFVGRDFGLKLRNYFPSQFAFDFLELLHVLLSAQIKIGHATVWMRIRVCVSFILRPSLLPFGFAPWFARILRETFTGSLTRIAATESGSLCERMKS